MEKIGNEFIRWRPMTGEDLGWTTKLQAEHVHAPRPRLFHQCNAGQTGLCYVLQASEGNEIFYDAGYVLLQYDDGVLHISEICLSPQYQGRGVGRWAIHTIKGMASAVNIEAEDLFPKQDIYALLPTFDYKAASFFMSVGFSTRCRQTDGQIEATWTRRGVAVRNRLVKYFSTQEGSQDDELY